MVRLMAEYPIEVTHPEKLIWPSLGIDKIEYLTYLTQMAPQLLHHLKDRPVTLIRYPHGYGGHSFYQKRAPSTHPDWLSTVSLWSKEHREWRSCILVDSVASLLWLGNQGALEFHIGYARYPKLDEPTWLTFDLDPSTSSFEPVREIALDIHRVLMSLDVPHVAKTSGATGLQIFIPLTAGQTYTATRAFLRFIAMGVVQRNPRWATVERRKVQRGARVYVDYLQHHATKTLISAYSPRATAAATVSTPLLWNELERGVTPTDFTIRCVPERVAELGDLLADCEDHPISLTNYEQ